jgi:hypothetical protein
VTLNPSQFFGNERGSFYVSFEKAVLAKRRRSVGGEAVKMTRAAGVDERLLAASLA